MNEWVRGQTTCGEFCCQCSPYSCSEKRKPQYYALLVIFKTNTFKKIQFLLYLWQNRRFLYWCTILIMLAAILDFATREWEAAESLRAQSNFSWQQTSVSCCQGSQALHYRKTWRHHQDLTLAQNGFLLELLRFFKSWSYKWNSSSKEELRNHKMVQIMNEVLNNSK